MWFLRSCLFENTVKVWLRNSSAHNLVLGNIKKITPPKFILNPWVTPPTPRPILPRGLLTMELQAALGVLGIKLRSPGRIALSCGALAPAAQAHSFVTVNLRIRPMLSLTSPHLSLGQNVQTDQLGREQRTRRKVSTRLVNSYVQGATQRMWTIWTASFLHLYLSNPSKYAFSSNGIY